MARGTAHAPFTLPSLAGAPRIYGFQAYDCNNASAPLEQYSLLEPEPCPDMLSTVSRTSVPSFVTIG